jgi:hypothetical protein
MLARTVGVIMRIKPHFLILFFISTILVGLFSASEKVNSASLALLFINQRDKEQLKSKQEISVHESEHASGLVE